MFDGFHTVEMMMKQRQRALLAQAESMRRANIVARRHGRRPLFAPALAGFGKAFMAMGQRLRNRYAPAEKPARCPDCGAPIPS